MPAGLLERLARRVVVDHSKSDNSSGNMPPFCRQTNTTTTLVQRRSGIALLEMASDYPSSLANPVYPACKLLIKDESWAGMGGATSVQAVLQVVGEFDEYGGASLGLVAWELCVEERLVAGAWERARATRLIAPAGCDQHERLWRLTPAGWAARQPKSA
jgi:hypothetical protein